MDVNGWRDIALACFGMTTALTGVTYAGIKGEISKKADKDKVEEAIKRLESSQAELGTDMRTWYSKLHDHQIDETQMFEELRKDMQSKFDALTAQLNSYHVEVAKELAHKMDRK